MHPDRPYPASAVTEGPEGRWARYTRRKLVADVAREAAASDLKRELTAKDLVLIGVGGMIGAGIFTVVGRTAMLAGPGVSISYGIAGLACVFAALCYAELAAAVPAAGAAYSYTYVTMGRLAAWIIAWNLVAEFMVGNMGVAIAWGDNLEAALNIVGIEIPARLSASPGTLVDGVSAWFDLPAFLIVMAVTVIIAVGIEASNATNILLSSLKLGALFLFIALGALKVDPANWSDFVPNGSGAVLGAAAIAFFAYIGFDAVSAAAEEAKDPQRDLPIGIIGSLLVTTVVYVAVILVLVGIVPFDEVDQGAALVDAFTVAGYSGLDIVVAFGAVAATTSVILVFQLGIARILLGTARDRLIPGGLARIHPKYRTPARLTVIGGVLTALGAGLVPFGNAIDFTSLSTLFLFIVVSVAVLFLRRLEPDLPRPFRVPAAPFVVAAAVLSFGFLMFQLGFDIWMYFVAWNGIGLVLFGVYGAHRREAGAD